MVNLRQVSWVRAPAPVKQVDFWLYVCYGPILLEALETNPARPTKCWQR